MVAAPCLLGIEWGLGKRRAYLIGAAGKCLHVYQDAQGALASQGHFADSLRALRRQLGIDARMPVVMSGMVGSAQGWQEVAYLDSSVPLGRLADTLVPVAGAPGCFIVPGYCYRDRGGIDVMRGEETRLLGAHLLKHGDGCYVLPGTRSKWVELAGGTIDRLTTLVSDANRAQYAEALRHTLVAAGAAPILYLIAAQELTAPYRDVAQMLGYATKIIDPDQAYCAALARFMEAIR